jgi:16S rRNA (cytidine1402-2'-O)-methyltransferase
MIYLIPTHLGNTDTAILPAQIKNVLENCDVIFSENLKTTRHFLKAISVEKKIDDFEWHVLTKDSTLDELQQFLKIAITKTCGIISEAGVPAIADPGAALIKLAHQKNIKVIPLVGPSSVLMALMASGMNGQSFAFTGYLPIDKNERNKKIKHLELLATKENQPQIFIETPYRNNQLLQDLISFCMPNTLLCIAADITLVSEFIQTKKIADWENNIPDLNKRPAVFIIG